VGRNEPYAVSLDYDFTVPVHGDVRGLASALIEIRQDLVTDVFGIERWSRMLAKALAAVERRLDVEPEEIARIKRQK
jgi:predicted N-formylglutamate amidohydrolase